MAWWRHQMETFSALLAICAGSSPHKGQWRGALMFFLVCVWINGWVNNHEAGDLRRYRAHYDVIVMEFQHWLYQLLWRWWHDIRNEIGSCHSAASCVAGNFGWTSWSSCNRKTQVEQMDTGATAGCSYQLGQQLQLQLCVQNVNKIWCQFANIRACTSVEYGAAQHVINSTGHVNKSHVYCLTSCLFIL